MKGAEVQGATSDPAARAGEGLTTRMCNARCVRCGGRMEEILESYTKKVVKRRCAGGCPEIEDEF